MKILVTGGAGNVGGYVVEELKRYHDVTILDVKPSGKHPEIPLIIADLTKLAEALSAVKGFDIVVHLAAIPNPSKDPGDRVLGVNVISTYHVLEAVRLNGIPRVIYGCSESASGWGIHNVTLCPEYLPIDEEHPSWPHESYSLSKYIGEEMGRCYSKSYGFEFVSLRYTWVLFQEDKERLAPHFRAMQNPDVAKNAFLGSCVFAEDVAQAVRLSVDFQFPEGSRMEVFYIFQDSVSCAMDSLELAGVTFGSLPPIKDPAYFEKHPRGSLFDTRKAKRMLGYKPRHSHKEWL
ncbi:MAG TPA: NAD-dependent epimerase/dehydratase family protein [Candidatus Brocadiia bacterium]|nr:NAD-dependent epimerase/dehydratase family protein [Candidatus Brocadiia bacterium]